MKKNLRIESLQMAMLAVLVMDEGKRVISGREAQRLIVKTAQEISDRVRSTLGPLGMDKMLVDSMGNQLLTNDGATILKNLEMKDPVGKLIIEVAKAQESRYYDGTTSCVVLVGELLRSADELIEKGIHPNIITKGYRRALEIAIHHHLHLHLFLL